MKKTTNLFLIFICGILLSGCATVEKAKKADILEMQVLSLKKKNRQLRKDNDSLLKEKVDSLDELRKEKDNQIKKILSDHKNQINQLHQKYKEQMAKINNRHIEERNRLLNQKNEELKEIQQNTNKELTSMQQAHQDLAKSLKSELDSYKAKLEMTERGLIITFLAEIFFSSGKDVLQESAKETLQKVAIVLNKAVIDSNIAVEGHTDNVPIKHSSWKSNWELSSARALAVVHHFIDEANIAPQRLSARGYGEYQPVASNDTTEGKQQNRRVEIIILPVQQKENKAVLKTE